MSRLKNGDQLLVNLRVLQCVVVYIMHGIISTVSDYGCAPRAHKGEIQHGIHRTHRHHRLSRLLASKAGRWHPSLRSN